MDTRTLAVTVALVSAALAVLMTVLAVYRRHKSLWVYACGFLGGMAAFLLFLGQGTTSPWLSIVLANGFLVVFHFCLPWGLRLGLGLEPSWPRRFWVYVIVGAVLELALTFGGGSFVLRAYLSSVASVVWAFEFLYVLAFRAPLLPPVVRWSAVGVGIAFLVAHAVRFVLLSGEPASSNLLANNNGITVYTLLFSTVFAVLLAGTILIVEIAGLFRKMEERNAVLKTQAHTDELTGLFNRHQLELSLANEMERSLRYSQPLSLILIDLDHFKNVNDTWGHQAGDLVLKQTTQEVAGLIRGPDGLFRWGGEEFMLLVPQTTREGAVQLAEKLRLAIEATDFPVEQKVTASFGVAEWSPPESRDAWIEKVDVALYRAKDGGRNRVVSWDPGDAMPVARVRLEWRQEWESGSPLIDSEHRELLQMANVLLDRSLSGQSGEAIGEKLDELLEHVVKHFADEEKELVAAGYPSWKEHAELHKRLVLDAKALRAAFRRGEAEIGVLFQFLVSKVVIGHILGADVRFFPYTRKAGR